MSLYKKKYIIILPHALSRSMVNPLINVFSTPTSCSACTPHIFLRVVFCNSYTGTSHFAFHGELLIPVQQRLPVCLLFVFVFMHYDTSMFQ